MALGEEWYGSHNMAKRFFIRYDNDASPPPSSSIPSNPTGTTWGYSH